MHLAWNNPIFEFLCNNEVVYSHPFTSIPARNQTVCLSGGVTLDTNIWLSKRLPIIHAHLNGATKISKFIVSSYFPMGFPDQEKPCSMSFSLWRCRYASINFPLKHNPHKPIQKIFKESKLVKGKKRYNQTENIALRVVLQVTINLLSVNYV